MPEPIIDIQHYRYYRILVKARGQRYQGLILGSSVVVMAFTDKYDTTEEVIDAGKRRIDEMLKQD
jgi:hypothetical protein